MRLAAERTSLDQILPLRALYLQEMNCQIRYNACHERGWSDSYLLMADGDRVGYGAVKGREIKDRDTVFEFFVADAWRNRAHQLFRELISAASPQWIECQSNDRLLSAMLFEFSSAISADTILFEDHAATRHEFPGVVRPKREGDAVFEHQVEPAGDYVLEADGEVIATGGFMLHYNKPFADLYMEVRADQRGHGAGSFLLQEVKKACYLAGRVPAARCGLSNTASRATLIRAGLRVSGFMLTGRIDRTLAQA